MRKTASGALEFDFSDLILIRSLVPSFLSQPLTLLRLSSPASILEAGAWYEREQGIMYFVYMAGGGSVCVQKSENL